MPERRHALLKFPYKFFAPDRTKNIRQIVQKYAGSDASVDTATLYDILREIYEVQSKDHREDWLEVERWTEGLRDLTAPPYTPPLTTYATFNCTQQVPITQTATSGWPWTDSTLLDSLWDRARSDDTANFQVQGVPVITKPGVYNCALWCRYMFDASNPDPKSTVKAAKLEVTSWPHITLLPMTGTQDADTFVLGQINWVMALDTDDVPYALNTHVGIFCPSALTSMTDPAPAPPTHPGSSGGSFTNWNVWRLPIGWP